MDFTRRLIQLGGREWINYGKHRIYFDEKILCDAIGLNITRYETGNISHASLNGGKISNSKAAKMLPTKFFYDCVDSTFYWEGRNENIGPEIAEALKNRVKQLENEHVPIGAKLIEDFETIKTLEKHAEEKANTLSLTFGTFCTYTSRRKYDGGEGNCAYFLHHGPKPAFRKNADFLSSWIGDTKDHFSADRLKALKKVIEYLDFISPALSKKA